MISRFSRDLVLCINDFLPWIDAFMWKQSCKVVSICVVERATRPWYQDDYKLVLAHLTGRIPNPVAFCAALKNHEHYLGGSSMLSCVLSEEWKDAPVNDIDVFTRSELRADSDSEYKYPTDHLPLHQYSGHTQFMHDAFEFQEKFHTESEIRGFDWERDQINTNEKLSSKMRRFYHQDEYEMLALHAIGYQIHETKEKMDYVFVNRQEYSSVKDFFNGCNDFAFNCILFDGVRFHVKFPDSIVERKCLVKTDNIKLFRKKKHHSWDKIRVQLWKRLLARCKKYRERGFSIDLAGSTDCWISENHVKYRNRRKSVSDIRESKNPHVRIQRDFGISKHFEMKTRREQKNQRRVTRAQEALPIFSDCYDIRWKKRNPENISSCPSSPASKSWKQRVLDPKYPQDQAFEVLEYQRSLREQTYDYWGGEMDEIL